MTHADWVKVVEAVRGVDGDCGSCVSYVCVKLVQAFPNVLWRPVLEEALVGKNLWGSAFVTSILEDAR